MDGYVVINTELNTKSFDRKIEKLEDELEGLIEEYDILSNDSSWNTQSEEAIKLREKIEQVNNQLIETRKKQKDLDNNSFGNIKEQVNNIGRGIENITKKVVKWGLAVFGVRSAYNYIRSAMTTLSQYNQQLATDLQYIRFSLEFMYLPPVLSLSSSFLPPNATTLPVTSIIGNISLLLNLSTNSPLSVLFTSPVAKISSFLNPI